MKIFCWMCFGKYFICVSYEFTNGCVDEIFVRNIYRDILWGFFTGILFVRFILEVISVSSFLVKE